MTSGVKNWYINFFIGVVGPCGMPIGDKNVIFFSRFRFLAFKVFRAPPSERVYTPPVPPPYPSPGTPLGGQQGGFAPNYDGTQKRKAKTNSHTPTGRRIIFDFAIKNLTLVCNFGIHLFCKI